MAKPLRILLFFTHLSLLFFQSFAQTHTPKQIAMGSFTNGYYEYLPQGYDANGSQTYPLLIFVHGGGDIGNGNPEEIQRLLRVGVTRLIYINQFPPSFTVNGQNFKFIVISPQFTQMHNPAGIIADLDLIIDYATKHYKVDRNRIYMTGLSKGGGCVLEYAGQKKTNGNKLAAIVTAAEASFPLHEQARTIAASNLPVWATHNSDDPDVPASYTSAYVDWINEIPTPIPAAKKTIFPGVGHDAWTQTYNPEFRENSLNVYEWMLQYKRVPLQISDYKGLKSGPYQITVSWTTANEKDLDHFTLERSANNIDFTTIAVVRALNRNNNTYTQFDDKPFSGDNYYRLSYTSVDGTITYYNTVQVRLNGAGNLVLRPNPVKDQMQIRLEGPEKGLVTASVFSSNGVLVKQWMLDKKNDLLQENLSVIDLAAATYILQIKIGSYVESRQFTKQ